MIDALFDVSVQALYRMAGALGMSYEAINVWLFLVLWPVLTLALIAVIVLQRLKIRRLESATPTPALSRPSP